MKKKVYKLKPKDINSKAFKTKKKVGDIYYDITDGQFKQVRKTPDGFGIKIIDIDTYDATAEEAAKVDKDKPKAGLFNRPTKPEKDLKEILPDFTSPDDLPI